MGQTASDTVQAATEFFGASNITSAATSTVRNFPTPIGILGISSVRVRKLLAPTETS